MPGLFNNLEPISIPKKEYSELIKCKERIEIIKRIIGSYNSISLLDLKMILDIKTEECKQIPEPSANLDDYADY